MGRKTALFAGTTIAYSAKWQITVATSSTEAEFVQAVLAAKMANNVKLAHIHRIANPADALTKALGWTLHHHHATSIMGHLGAKYTNTVGRI
eukprot:8994688-Ditylum_brightwellii.AAC.1